MANFIYLYRGPTTPMSNLTAEQGAERMAAFGAWMEKVGPALVDIGSPFGTSASVRDDGTEGTPGDLIGYTIVEADDLDAAKALPTIIISVHTSTSACVGAAHRDPSAQLSRLRQTVQIDGSCAG